MESEYLGEILLTIQGRFEILDKNSPWNELVKQ